MLPQAEPGLVHLAHEHARLAEENEVLRESCANLTAAAEAWIRLYESALARANTAEDILAQQALRNW